MNILAELGVLCQGVLDFILPLLCGGFPFIGFLSPSFDDFLQQVLPNFNPDTRISFSPLHSQDTLTLDHLLTLGGI